MQDKVTEMAEKTITDALQGAGVPSVPEAPSIIDFTRASARSRALRTFFVGLGISVLWALVNMLGQLGDVDWFHKEGWTSVATLAVGAVISAVSSYALRIIKPPSYAPDHPANL